MSKIISIISLLFSFSFANSQTVDFTFQSNNGLFCNTSTIQFTQKCTGNPTGFIWNLGNGLKSFTPNTSTGYSFAGTYTVKLTAIYPQGAVEVTKRIVIYPKITPTLSVDRNYICQPGIINFKTATNGNIATYQWNFGDGSPVVTTSINNTGHSFANYGNYTVIVKATDVSGCFGYDTIAVAVKKLPITGAIDSLSGCIPSNVNFTSNVMLPSNGSVNSYVWDFGDGSAPISTGNSAVNHTYNKVDTFLPRLTITTNEGCSNTFNFPPVAYGSPPVITNAYPQKPVICGSETAVLVAKSSSANRYLWDFGDGKTEQTEDTIILHKYLSVGSKTITVTPFLNNCPGIPITFKMSVTGVIAAFNFRNTCNDKKTFSIQEYSSGRFKSVLWNFGDGSPISNTKGLFTHTFPDNGAFIITLAVRDSVTACTDTLKRTLYTANPTIINKDTSICKSTQTSFTLENNYLNPSATYSWTTMGRNDYTKNNPSLKVYANFLGYFNNYVIINNYSPSQLYCYDTIYLDHKILVRGPLLDFTIPANVCFPDSVNIINNSKPFIPKDTIKLWYWNYGNSNLNDTIFTPDPVAYNIDGSYRIKLTAIDINGCKANLSKSVSINPLPFLQVLPKNVTLCSGQTDTLFAYHSNDILWEPSNRISCNTCDTILVNPTMSTQYFATATSSFNCSIKDSIFVEVIQPFTAINSLGNQYICKGEEVMLNMDPKNRIINWSPSLGLSNPGIYNPIAKPNQTTTYTATLTDSIGCFTSKADATVFLKISPTVYAGSDKYVTYNSNFTISPVYSNNVRQYLWKPPTMLNCSTCPNASGTAMKSQMYTIQVTSDSGCVASDSILIYINCKDANILIPKAFSPNNDNLNDYFYPITNGIQTIKRFTIYNREGQILYEAKNFSPNDKFFSWDGNFKGIKQPSRAFVYVIEALCFTGEKIIKSGSFILLR